MHGRLPERAGRLKKETNQPSTVIRDLVVYLDAE